MPVSGHPRWTPQMAGRQTAGHQTAEPQAAEPQKAEPQAAGSQKAGSQMSLQTAEPQVPRGRPPPHWKRSFTG